MKRIFAAVLSAMLVLSLAACTDSTENSSQTSSGSSSVAEQSSEPDTSDLTVKEDVSNLDTKPESKPEKPAEQPSQPSTPAAPETEDTGWTQAKVDAVVEAYRSAALERGWTEDTSLNIALTTGGAWGTPIDTRWADYNVETNSANIEEYLYGREYARNAEPEDMYFHVVVEEYSDYWEIYFIFA